MIVQLYAQRLQCVMLQQRKAMNVIIPSGQRGVHAVNRVVIMPFKYALELSSIMKIHNIAIIV
jgi:hypothetical protein